MLHYKETTVSERVGEFDLTFDTGKLAKNADGSLVVRYGDMFILAAVVTKEAAPGMDFFPLTVEYKEPKAAAGKIPGGFFKREGKPRRKETLTCRLIDRPLRPLFPKGYTDEVQISVFVYSADGKNDPDVIGVNAASAALMLSGVPFYGPVGAVRVCRVDGKLVTNPSDDLRAKADMELLVVGTEEEVVMIEAECKEVAEEDVLDGIAYAKEDIKRCIDLQLKLVKEAEVTRNIFEREDNSELLAKVESTVGSLIDEAVAETDEEKRENAFNTATEKLVEETVEKSDAEGDDKKDLEKAVKNAFSEIKEKKIRERIKAGKRLDGREVTEVRQITGEVGLLPNAHGSAVFTRGGTQALVLVTLGSSEDKQPIKGLHPEREEKFYLHYDFLPFSTGEIGWYRGPKRREIGHGMLAQKALEAVLPDDEDFPYTMRAVSQILESNGSSSMATVCGSTMAMMDCGVKIKRPVAGIAMGLVRDGDSHVILSDILGAEDHYGDMDFKVAGTQKGITAIQLDLKIMGISDRIISETLEQAREGRLHILRKMLDIIEKPNEEYGDNVPQIARIQVDQSKIGAIIGPGGKTIKGIEARYNAKVEINDDGIVHIMAGNKQDFSQAKDYIETLVKGPEVGKIYEGKVKTVKNFGAFVEIIPGVDGLVHISDLENGFVKNVEDVVREGDTCRVKVMDVDKDGKIKLSRKVLLEDDSPKEEDSE